MFFSRTKTADRPADRERNVSFFVEQLEYREMLTGGGGPSDDIPDDSGGDEPPVEVYDD